MSNPKYKFVSLSDGTRAPAFVQVDGDGEIVTGNVKSYTKYENLSTGDNAITHNLNATVIGVTVYDSGTIVAVTGGITDANTFNINLSGGSVTNAMIILFYN